MVSYCYGPCHLACQPLPSKSLVYTRKHSFHKQSINPYLQSPLPSRDPTWRWPWQKCLQLSVCQDSLSSYSVSCLLDFSRCWSTSMMVALQFWPHTLHKLVMTSASHVQIISVSCFTLNHWITHQSTPSAAMHILNLSSVFSLPSIPLHTPCSLR